MRFRFSMVPIIFTMLLQLKWIERKTKNWCIAVRTKKISTKERSEFSRNFPCENPTLLGTI
jgi:hypothetical protein